MDKKKMEELILSLKKNGEKSNLREKIKNLQKEIHEEAIGAIATLEGMPFLAEFNDKREEFLDICEAALKLSEINNKDCGKINIFGGSPEISLSDVELKEKEDMLSSFLSEFKVLRSNLFLVVRSEVGLRLREIIYRHGDVLLRKRQQLEYKDEFGDIVFEHWRKYLLDYLINKVKFSSYDDAFNALEEANGILDEIEDNEENNFSGTSNFNDAIEYEKFCAQRMEDLGWDARLTARSGDQGVDVIAEKNGYRVAMQCKMHSAPVGNSAVQEVIAGKIFEQADRAVVVSSAGFTKSARQLADLADVILLHHNELAVLNEILNSNR